MHQLSLPSRTHARVLPNLAAALQASLLAGAAMFLALELIGLAAHDESAWYLLREIAAVLRGTDVLDDPRQLDFAVIATGLALFYAAWVGALAYRAFRRE